MSRAVRVEYSGALYHVMSRGVGRKRVFLDDEDREEFLRGVGEFCGSGDLVVHAFCLMPNHWHLLCETPRGCLSRWMRHINGDYAQGFNRRHGRVGYLWQGRYKAILVEGGRYSLECSRYIHLNPNRAKLTRPAERWRWSSYRNYVGGPKVVEWVTTAPTLAHFDGDLKKYRAYVEAGKGVREVSPLERAVAGLVLGGEGFVGRIRKLVEGREATPEAPSLRELRCAGAVSADEIERAVEGVFRGETRRRRGQMKLFALRRYSGLRPGEIARRHGRTHGAVAHAVRDVEARLSRNETLVARLQRLARMLRHD